jgi:hypothetical protein
VVFRHTPSDVLAASILSPVYLAAHIPHLLVPTFWNISEPDRPRPFLSRRPFQSSGFELREAATCRVVLPLSRLESASSFPEYQGLGEQGLKAYGCYKPGCCADFPEISIIRKSAQSGCGMWGADNQATATPCSHHTVSRHTLVERLSALPAASRDCRGDKLQHYGATHYCPSSVMLGTESARRAGEQLERSLY